MASVSRVVDRERKTERRREREEEKARGERRSGSRHCSRRCDRVEERVVSGEGNGERRTRSYSRSGRDEERRDERRIPDVKDRERVRKRSTSRTDDRRRELKRARYECEGRTRSRSHARSSRDEERREVRRSREERSGHGSKSRAESKRSRRSPLREINGGRPRSSTEERRKGDERMEDKRSKKEETRRESHGENRENEASSSVRADHSGQVPSTAKDAEESHRDDEYGSNGEEVVVVEGRNEREEEDGTEERKDEERELMEPKLIQEELPLIEQDPKPEEQPDIPAYKEIRKNIHFAKILDRNEYDACTCKDGTCIKECVRRATLVECGRECPSGRNCTNKLIQKRKEAKVEVFYTGSKKGFGLRAVERIEEGAFIIEYMGEVMSEDQSKARKRRYARNPKKYSHNYMMAVDDSSKNTFIIDATLRGNSARFANHSCDPNAFCDKWSVKGKFRMGLYAKRTIFASEEITFDYRFKNDGDKKQECCCGTALCRKYLSTTREVKMLKELMARTGKIERWMIPKKEGQEEELEKRSTITRRTMTPGGWSSYIREGAELRNKQPDEKERRGQEGTARGSSNHQRTDITAAPQSSSPGLDYRLPISSPYRGYIRPPISEDPLLLLTFYRTLWTTASYATYRLQRM